MHVWINDIVFLVLIRWVERVTGSEFSQKIHTCQLFMNASLKLTTGTCRSGMSHLEQLPPVKQILTSLDSAQPSIARLKHVSFSDYQWTCFEVKACTLLPPGAVATLLPAGAVANLLLAGAVATDVSWAGIAGTDVAEHYKHKLLVLVTNRCPDL